MGVRVEPLQFFPDLPRRRSILFLRQPPLNLPTKQALERGGGPDLPHPSPLNRNGG